MEIALDALVDRVADHTASRAMESHRTDLP